MPKKPVLTIFAGPNGSGKSTLTQKILNSGYDLGTYINADEIVIELAQKARLEDQKTSQYDLEVEAFHEAGRRRYACLDKKDSFAFETVFSHISKIDLIKDAKEAGYYIHFYFVSTENALLNVERVKKRVSEGGHDVPYQKIIDRYKRTMGLLAPACMEVDEAILFDNSTTTMRLAAKLSWSSDGSSSVHLVKPVAQWVRAWNEEIVNLVTQTKRQ